MSRWLRRFIYLFLFYLMASALVAVVVMEASFHPAHRQLTPADENTMSQIAHGLDATLKDVSISASDGVQLKAWSIQPTRGNGNTVLLLHGLGDNRLGMTGYAELFLSHGYGVLMPDARGHGVSGGQIVTYGFLERNDIHQWFEWIVFNQLPHCVMDWENPWARLNYLNHSKSSRTSALLLWNLHSRLFVKSHTIASVNFSIQAHGSGARSCAPQ